MKIKSDFVTNSSSTSYLVCLPDNFDITKFLHIIDPENSWWFEEYLDASEEVKKEIMEKLKERLIKLNEKLLKHTNIYEYDSEYDAYHVFIKLLEELDLIIDSWDTSSDNGMICGVDLEKVERIKNGGWGIKHGGWGVKSGEDDNENKK